MNKIKTLLKTTLALLLLVFLGTSCLDKEVERRQDDANAKFQKYLQDNNYNDEHHIGFGVYVKVIESGDENGALPVNGQNIRLDYKGMYTDGTLFESTDSGDASSLNFGEYFIYGPAKHIVGTLIPGFDTAIKTITEGTVAQFVIPHEMAFGNYEPVVYDVSLHDLISNDSIDEYEAFKQFKEANDFNDTMNLGEGLLYKLVGVDTSLRTDPVVRVNDTIKLELTGRFAETYYGNNQGRVFYPRGEETLILSDYLWGTKTDYPMEENVNKAIDSAVKYMRVGETMELAFTSGAYEADSVRWGYGIDPKVDPLLNYIVVPPITPLHFTLKLLYSQNDTL